VYIIKDRNYNKYGVIKMKKEERKPLQEKFLIMRFVEGKSFKTISDELDVSKQTLVNWNKELKDEIEDLENAEKEELIEKYKSTKKARLDNFLLLHEKIKEELEKRDFSNVSFKVLFEKLLDTERILNNNLSIKQATGEIIPFDESILESLSKANEKEYIYFENRLNLD